MVREGRSQLQDKFREQEARILPILKSLLLVTVLDKFLWRTYRPKLVSRLFRMATRCVPLCLDKYTNIVSFIPL